MKDLFRAEWRRFLPWVLLFGVAHLVALVFFSRLVDLGQQAINMRRMFGVFYTITGALLGLYQMGTWRRPGHWLNLLHRPVAPRRIGIALLGAGIAGVVVAIALPMLAVGAWQALGTARIMEARQWMLPGAATLVTTCAYLGGAFAMLAHRRYAVCGLVPLMLIAFAQASGAQALLVQCVATAGALAMVLIAFRPDLGSAPRTVAGTIAMALPVQAGAWLAIVLLGFLGELAWVMFGSHPNNMPVPPRGGTTQQERMSPRDRMLAGLAHATGPDVELWREQVALSEVHPLLRAISTEPVRGEMNNTVPLAFSDAGSRTEWVFSHRSMRFEGASLAEGRHAGTLGVGSANAAFPAIAFPGAELPGMSRGDVALQAGGVLYQYRAVTRHVVPRLVLPGNEHILGTAVIDGSLVVRSERAVRIYDGRHLTDSDALPAPRQVVPMPGEPGDVSDVEMVALVDGYLLSFTFSAHAGDMTGVAPYQAVVWVDDAGRVTTVATVSLGQDFPAVYRYRTWWPSPLMHTVAHAAARLFAPHDPLEQRATPPVPESIRQLAVLVLLASGGFGAWLAWRRGLSWPARAAWIAACCVVGPPAVASLAAIVPAVEKPAPAPGTVPAT
jgi:hypothetical protein